MKDCCKKLVAVLFFAFFAFNLLVFDIIGWLDILKPATAVRDEGCVLKKGVRGGEDLVKWNDQVLLTGSTNRANWFRRIPLHITPKGKIYAINGFSKDLKSWEIKKMPVYELPLVNYPLGTSF